MKTLLVALNSKFVHSNLAIRYLKVYAKDFDVELYETTINNNPFDIAIEIAMLKVDSVGFSCYIWNIENTLKVCSLLKEINKDIKIFLGGPEVSYNPYEVIKENPFIDFVIFGEGEETFKEFLLYQVGLRDIKSIDGIAYRNKEEIIVNNPRSLIENLDEISFPYDVLPQRIIYYEASRGCPFNCKYCLSSTIKGLRFFSLERVKKDLKYFIDNKVKLVKFVDRTFNANKKFAIEIWRFLIENASETRFHFEIAVDLLDDECFEVLKEAPKGLFQFEIGVQTTNPVVLRNINRIMDFKRVEKNVLKLNEYKNIHSHLDLIVGLPGEDLNSFKKSFNEVMGLKPDVLQIGFLKVLRGSPVSFESQTFGIKYSKYPPYQVLKTNDISLEEMVFLLKFEEAFEIFYNSGTFKITLGYFISRISNYFDFFSELTQFLDNVDFFKVNHDINSKFRNLFAYLARYEDKEIVKDLLIHDYLIITKKAYLPEFLKKEEVSLKQLAKNYKEVNNFEPSQIRKLLALPVKAVFEEGRYKIEERILVINPHEQKFLYL